MWVTRRRCICRPSLVLSVSQIIESWSPRISFSRPDSATLTHCTVLELGRSGHFHVESAEVFSLWLPLGTARACSKRRGVGERDEHIMHLPPLGTHSNPPQCHPARNGNGNHPRPWCFYLLQRVYNIVSPTCSTRHANCDREQLYIHIYTLGVFAPDFLSDFTRPLL